MHVRILNGERATHSSGDSCDSANSSARREVEGLADPRDRKHYLGGQPGL
jgi:hypothetical protein